MCNINHEQIPSIINNLRKKTYKKTQFNYSTTITEINEISSELGINLMPQDDPWRIMNTILTKLDQHTPKISQFPIIKSECCQTLWKTGMEYDWN